MLLFIVSLLIPVLIGYLTTCNLCKEVNLNQPGRIALGAGIGLGISSCIFFICLILFGPYIQAVKLIEIIILLILLYFYLRKRSEDISIPEKPHIILSLAFYLQLFFSLTCFLLLVTIYVHGNWDSMLIWNLHAKFLYTEGIFWKSYFSSGMNWTHPDYPLLVPALVSRCWYYINNVNLLIPQFIALIFIFSTAGLLCSSLSCLKNKNHGYLAGIILLGTPFFILSGNSLCADIPLSFFFLATVVLLFFAHKSSNNRNFLILAGLCAGLAGWCKNEGLLFLISIVIAQIIVISFTGNIKAGIKRLKFFFIGLIPILIMLIYFKTQIAPASDLILGQNWESIWHKLSDFARYRLIFNYYMLGLNSFTMGIISPVILIAGSIIAGIKTKNEYSEPIKTYLMTLSLVLIGYFIIYLITPHNLEWHLSNSINRLFIQLWPSFIFVCFMIIKHK